MVVEDRVGGLGDCGHLGDGYAGRSVLGTEKTLVFVSLMVVMSTLTGWTYGAFF